MRASSAILVLFLTAGPDSGAAAVSPIRDKTLVVWAAPANPY